MADLITRTRRYAGDPATGGGYTQHFSDQEVQDTLDEHRYQVTDAFLTPVPQISVGGQLNYNRYEAGQGNWEAPETPDTPNGFKLKAPDYSVITPDTSDYLAAVWTFNLAYPGRVPPVRITGKFYDCWGAAADLLEAWAAASALSVDADLDGQKVFMSQFGNALQARADKARTKQMAGQAHIARTDLAEESTAGGFAFSSSEAL